MSAARAITVVAHWQMPEAAMPEVLKLVAAARQHSLAEAGCLGYEVFRSIDDAGSLLLVERYRDDAAIDAHRQSLHYRELVAARIVPLLTSRQVELLRN